MTYYNTFNSAIQGYPMEWNILGSSKISTRYQVTLPEGVREKLKIKDGEQIIFSEEEGKIVLRNSKLIS